LEFFLPNQSTKIWNCLSARYQFLSVILKWGPASTSNYDVIQGIIINWDFSSRKIAGLL
jgi:hypothetical protein